MNATTSVDQYDGTRTRITETVESLPADALAIRVPACPEWTVHNLISHLAGVAADFVTGNLEGVPQPPWTAVQVEARRDLPIEVILDECPGTVTIHTPESTYALGTGTPHAEVHTISYELFRAIFGRRSPSQIAAWSWTTPAFEWPTALPRLPQTLGPLID